MMVSAIWLPILNTGSSAVIGSWKIMDTMRPRKFVKLPLGGSDQVVAVDPHRARHHRSARRVQAH